MTTDLSKISDKELKDKLAELGHGSGPITASTRGVYQNLLERLLTEGSEKEAVAPSTPPRLTTPPPTEKVATEAPSTPITRSALKRSAEENQRGAAGEETFSIPSEKKKKADPSQHSTPHTGLQSGIPPPSMHLGSSGGSIPRMTGIPTYQVPSLRRTTIEQSALSKRLAEEVKDGGKRSSLKKPTSLKTTTKKTEETKGKEDKENALPPATTPAPARGETRGKQPAKPNVTIQSTPSYMRQTSSTMKKGGTGTRVTANVGRRKSGVGRRKSFRRAGRPTPLSSREPIPRVGGSAISKAKETTGGAASGVKTTGTKGKKRAAWDVKGRLEDVTNLYNELKEEKSTLDEKLEEVQTELQVKTADLDFLKTEAATVREDLESTKEALSESTRKCSELTIRCNDAEMERNEKVTSYERIKRERDEVEEDYQRTKSKLREADIRADDLERDVRRANNAKEEAEDSLAKSKKHVTELEETISQLKDEKEKLRETIREKEGEVRELEGTLVKERGEKGDVHNILKRKENHISFLDGRISTLEQEVKDLQETISEKGGVISKLEGNLDKEQRTHRDVNRLLEDREASICDLDQRLAVALEKLHAGEQVRRKLHNTIQELKGNIRVYCRVRPFLSSEALKGQPLEEIPQMEFSKDHCSLSLTSAQADKLGRKGEMMTHEFNFDHVFGPHSTQDETFEEVSGLVQSALDGYNVCIFAYGQTGSGKTHTMQGPIDPASDFRGIIPRSMEQVFKTGEELAEQGWRYTFTASFIEIYNETLHDLISATDEKIEIKLVNDKSRDVEVTNVKTVHVENSYDVHQLLLKANKNRTVAATKCNERSSRSHSVFRLKIEGRNTKNGDCCTGNLNLVDLAGSERVAHSGSTGQRLKEAQAINTSLAELGNVIMALNEKKTHIPYRNSKLTYLLCSSLGGNSKTLMFVNVSPLDKHTTESLNSLRFASKVNRVDIGTAKKNK